MIQRHYPIGKRQAVVRVVTAFAILAIVLGLTFTWPPIKRSLGRQSNRAEFNVVLRNAQPLRVTEGTGDCFLTTNLEGRDALFLASSPDHKDWYLLRKIGMGVMLKEVRDGATQGVDLLDNSGSAEELQLYRTGPRVDLYVPGSRPVSVRFGEDWEAWLVGGTKSEAEPPWTVKPFRSVVIEDSFTRVRLGHNDGWTIEEGSFSTQPHGGGKGASANAFALIARAAEGLVPTARTGWMLCANYEAQISALGETPQTSFFLELGNPSTARASFGWNGEEKSWQLLFRSMSGEHKVLLRRTMALRPGNWSRIGLRLDTPLQVTPLLDGVPLGSFVLDEPVYGQVRLRVKGGTAWFDDFELRGREDAPAEGSPLFVKSKSFDTKAIQAGKDADFVKWVHDTLSYDKVEIPVDEQPCPAYRFRAPIYGGLSYGSALKDVGRVIVRLEDEKGGHADFDFRRVGAQWVPAADAGQDAETDLSQPVPLELAYRNGELHQRGSDERLVGKFSSDGPLSLTLCTPGATFRPELHQVRSSNLWNEFFEQAPAAWRSWAGQYGMQYRWGCQPHWNWMGGWSRHLAVCFSRHAYAGDQTIDYYTCIKDLMLGKTNSRRYLRKELNFSFCTDGRNLCSGYSLLFGGYNNAGIYLMKGTEVLASTDQFRLPPPTSGHADVHWRWWHVRVEKRGTRITVYVDERKTLEATDKEPLEGGHVAYWSVGNGFMLAKAQIAAERRTNEPQKFWAKPSLQGALWEALEPGMVRLVPPWNYMGVVNNAGGGTFAVRWTGGPVDLSKTPVLRLPFRAGPGAQVNLHIQVSGKGYLIPLTAPVEKTPAVLCPAWLALTDAQAFYASESQTELPALSVLEPVKSAHAYILVDLLEALGNRAGPNPMLEGLIIGNASNKDYLMAGFSGNRAGAEYRVGVPMWLRRRE